MNIKIELLRGYMSDFIKNLIKDAEIDASQIADTTAMQALYEIQMVTSKGSLNGYSHIAIRSISGDEITPLILKL